MVDAPFKRELYMQHPLSYPSLAIGWLHFYRLIGTFPMFLVPRERAHVYWCLGCMLSCFQENSWFELDDWWLRKCKIW